MRNLSRINSRNSELVGRKRDDSVSRISSLLALALQFMEQDPASESASRASVKTSVSSFAAAVLTSVFVLESSMEKISLEDWKDLMAGPDVPEEVHEETLSPCVMASSVDTGFSSIAKDNALDLHDCRDNPFGISGGRLAPLYSIDISSMNELFNF